MNERSMIIYCSRSRLKGTTVELEAQTRRILASARLSNKKAHVTGAMTFNEIGFAQVLEGATLDVMPIFERIRRDARHGDLRVLLQTIPRAGCFHTGRWLTSARRMPIAVIR